MAAFLNAILHQRPQVGIRFANAVGTYLERAYDIRVLYLIETWSQGSTLLRQV